MIPLSPDQWPYRDTCQEGRCDRRGAPRQAEFASRVEQQERADLVCENNVDLDERADDKQGAERKQDERLRILIAHED